MAEEKEKELEELSIITDEPATSSYGQGSTYGIPAQKKPTPKRTLLYAIAVVIVLLIVGAVIAFFLIQKANTSKTPAGDPNVIATASVMDLPKVCEGKKLTNASELKKPYKFSAYMNQTGDSWVAYPYFGKGFENLSYLVGEVSVVACLAPDTSTVSGELKCTPKTVADDRTINITQKGVTYTITFLAAKTGEKVSEGKVVTPVGKDCIDFAEKDGTYYTMPASKDVESVFTKFFEA